MGKKDIKKYLNIIRPDLNPEAVEKSVNYFSKNPQELIHLFKKDEYFSNHLSPEQQKIAVKKMLRENYTDSADSFVKRTGYNVMKGLAKTSEGLGKTTLGVVDKADNFLPVKDEKTNKIKKTLRKFTTLPLLSLMGKGFEGMGEYLREQIVTPEREAKYTAVESDPWYTHAADAISEDAVPMLAIPGGLGTGTVTKAGGLLGKVAPKLVAKTPKFVSKVGKTALKDSIQGATYGAITGSDSIGGDALSFGIAGGAMRGAGHLAGKGIKKLLGKPKTADELINNVVNNNVSKKIENTVSNDTKNKTSATVRIKDMTDDDLIDYLKERKVEGLSDRLANEKYKKSIQENPELNFINSQEVENAILKRPARISELNKYANDMLTETQKKILSKYGLTPGDFYAGYDKRDWLYSGKMDEITRTRVKNRNKIDEEANKLIYNREKQKFTTDGLVNPEETMNALSERKDFFERLDKKKTDRIANEKYKKSIQENPELNFINSQEVENALKTRVKNRNEIDKEASKLIYHSLINPGKNAKVNIKQIPRGKLDSRTFNRMANEGNKEQLERIKNIVLSDELLKMIQTSKNIVDVELAKTKLINIYKKNNNMDELVKLERENKLGIFDKELIGAHVDKNVLRKIDTIIEQIQSANNANDKIMLKNHLLSLAVIHNLLGYAKKLNKRYKLGIKEL